MNVGLDVVALDIIFNTESTVLTSTFVVEVE